MHGLIHVTLKELILTKWGEDTWIAIGQELGFDTSKEDWDGPIMEMSQHDDAITVAGVSATAKVLGVTWDEALRVYGAFFVDFVHMGGHLRLLESMGDSLASLLVSTLLPLTLIRELVR
jgi:hypothetical protein